MITTLGKITTVVMGIGIAALILADAYALVIMRSFPWFAVLTLAIYMAGLTCVVMYEIFFMGSCPLTLPK